MEITDHLNCFPRNLYAGQEATIRTRHGTTDWFQIGKGVHKGSILPPCLFNLYAEYITRNAGLEEAQAGIKISGRNSYSFSSSHVWCESWTIKKAESWRIDAFKLWCWRRLLRVPWTARRANQSILKEIGPACSWKDRCWSWNSNNVATWCEELSHLKSPDAGKDWGQEEKGTMEDKMVGWHHWLNGHGFQWTPQGDLACCASWGCRVGHNWVTELNWTDSLRY